MISDSLRRQIELALWPAGDSTPGTLWAVLDCARDPRIYRELAVSRLDYQCLYSGDLATELKVVAPHMVELAPRYRFTRTLLDSCWGNSWGIFVRINDGTTLRHHLRKLSTVLTEDGRKLLFRYYDPRVLRAYLPTCTRDELQQMFGPISHFYAESADARSSLHSFAFDGALISARSIALTVDAAAA